MESEKGFLMEMIYKSVRMKRIVCANGVSMSVQAGESLYSTPRDNSGEYTEVEIGFIELDDKPFPTPEYLNQYAESLDHNNVSDIYAYVPVEILERFIAEQGGRKFFTTINPPRKA